MNSTTCLNVILKQIQKKSHLLENNQDLNNVASVLYKLGNLIMHKSLSCSLLKNVVIALQELHEKCDINKDEYDHFLKGVNTFYKSQITCPSFKLSLLTCFAPAVEVELLSLLNSCLNVTNVNELHIVRSAVENSILVQACQENEDCVKKVVGILKKAFILSEGNPVVGYLTVYLFKSAEQSFNNSCLLSKELNFLDTFFHFPYHLLTNDDEELLMKRLIKSSFEAVNMNLCSKDDIIFYTALYPTCYCRILGLSVSQASKYMLDFLMFLCKDNNFEFPDLVNELNSAQENLLWKFICD